MISCSPAAACQPHHHPTRTHPPLTELLYNGTQRSAKTYSSGVAMAVAASCRHASSIFRSSRYIFCYTTFGRNPLPSLPNRSRSCPDISRTIKPTVTSIQPRRQINMMILNPRASKIRYLNASHSLLIDLEKHVRKVQVRTAARSNMAFGEHD